MYRRSIGLVFAAALIVGVAIIARSQIALVSKPKAAQSHAAIALRVAG